MKKNRSYTWRVAGVACMTFGMATTFLSGLSSSLAPYYISIALFGCYLYSMGPDWKAFEAKEITLEQTSQRSLFKGLLFFVLGLLISRIRHMALEGNGWNSENLLMFAVVGVVLLTAYAVYQHNLASEPKVLGEAIRPETLKTSYLNEDRRRYTMVVEEIEDHGRETLVKGIVHGEIHVEDEILLLHPNKEGVYAKVVRIEGEDVSSKKDAPVSLVIDTPEVEMFSVIASYLPSEMPQGPQENPLLAGLSYEYGRNRGNHGFIGVFFNALVHSKFLVPVIMDHSPRNVNGHMEFMQDTKVGFMSVNRTDAGQSQKTFALFTDPTTLRKWRDLFKNGSHPKTLTLTFQDAVTIMWKGHQGIVINPFGPIYVYLSAELIDTITKQESYRKEFGAPGEHHLSFDRNRKD